MAEAGKNSFDSLVQGLSLEQRLEFFRVLHTAGVTRQDVELAQLLRALQLYKAFYDEIPATCLPGSQGGGCSPPDFQIVT